MASAYRRNGRRSCTIKYKVGGVTHTLRGFPDKTASKSLGDKIERLAALRAAGGFTSGW